MANTAFVPILTFDEGRTGKYTWTAAIREDGAQFSVAYLDVSVDLSFVGRMEGPRASYRSVALALKGAATMAKDVLGAGQKQMPEMRLMEDDK